MVETISFSVVVKVSKDFSEETLVSVGALDASKVAVVSVVGKDGVVSRSGVVVGVVVKGGGGGDALTLSVR